MTSDLSNYVTVVTGNDWNVTSTPQNGVEITAGQVWLLAQITILVCLTTILIPCSLAILYVKCRERGRCMCIDKLHASARRKSSCWRCVFPDPSVSAADFGGGQHHRAGDVEAGMGSRMANSALELQPRHSSGPERIFYVYDASFISTDSNIEEALPAYHMIYPHVVNVAPPPSYDIAVTMKKPADSN